MIDEFLTLRNTVHKDEFRFDLSPDLWKSSYLFGKEPEADTVIVIRKNGLLRGYAVCSIEFDHQIKVCGVLEICADGRDSLVELIDRIIEKGVKEDVDFIFLRRCEEPFDEVFDKKRFLTFLESAIMVALFNPKELLLPLSEEIEHGKTLKLIIEGFDPIIVKVGRNRIMVMHDAEPDFTVRTDSKTFLRLCFGKESFMRQFLKRNVFIDRLTCLPTILRFFSIIRNKKWYIPTGDRC